jgi:signal transduction histidine kinase
MTSNEFPQKSKQEFMIRLGRIVFLYGATYSLLFGFLGAMFTASVLMITAVCSYPAMIFLLNKKFERSARFLLISSGLIYIHTVIMTINSDINAQIYYLPSMLIALLVFEIHQKKEVALGIALPVMVWLLGKSYFITEFNLFFIDKSHIDIAAFRNLNFIGAFLITAIFLNYHRKHLVELNKVVSDEMEKIKSLSAHLNNSQRITKTGNWEMNFTTHNLVWSDEVYRIFEITKGSISPTLDVFLEATHPDDRELMMQKFAKAIESKTRYMYIHRLLMTDGRVKFLNEQCEFLYDEAGNAVLAIGTVQDITEQKLNDEFLNHSARMAALGEMAGGIAHEINNPLAIISGKSQLLLRKFKSQNLENESFFADVERINKNAERISKIVKSLKTISRNSEVDPMQVSSLEQIIEDVLELSVDRFNSKNVELRIDIPKDASLMCRPSEIGQVILNLVNNSFDAVSNFNERWIEVKAVQSEAMTRITVTDSGKGIPKSIVDKLMFPFFTTKDVGKGTGLGLSISKRVVEKHNGKFYYDESCANTCFVVEIPNGLACEADLAKAS